MLIKSGYVRPGFINLPTYQSTADLSAIDTTTFQSNAQAIVLSGTADNSPQLGMYKFVKNSYLPILVGQYDVLSAGGGNGQWIRSPESGIVVSSFAENAIEDMMIDLSNVPSGAQFASAATITSSGLTSSAGAGSGNVITISAPGALVGDESIVVMASYTCPDYLVYNGVTNNGAVSTANEISFYISNGATNPGPSTYYYVTYTP
jgi:hypothetical protein